MPINRITMFKIADEGDIQKMIDQYKKLESDNKKDGKQYVLSFKVRKTISDARSQGYTLTAEVNFASMDDMKYYDEECEAHGVLKAFTKGKVNGPPLSVFLEE